MVSRGRGARTAAAAAILAVGAFTAAGCTKALNSSDAGNVVNQTLARHGLKTKSVDCPGDVEAKEGKTFDCDFTLQNGKAGSMTIKITDVSGDNATLQPVSVHSANR